MTFGVLVFPDNVVKVIVQGALFGIVPSKRTIGFRTGAQPLERAGGATLRVYRSGIAATLHDGVRGPPQRGRVIHAAVAHAEIDSRGPIAHGNLRINIRQHWSVGVIERHSLLRVETENRSDPKRREAP